MGVEEYQDKTAGLIGAIYLIGKPPIRRHLVPVDGERNRSHPARFGLGDTRRISPIDNTRWKMPKKIGNMGPRNPLDGGTDARTDPRKGGNRLEKGKQIFRTHHRTVLTELLLGPISYAGLGSI